MYKVLIFFATSIFILIALFTPTRMAAEERKETSIVLPKDQIIDHDYFAAGNTVTLLGTVNGDAYIAGGNVIIEGTVNGDLLIAGGNLTINGKVRDDLRAAGGQIIVMGEVGRNITTVGGSVTIADSAKIKGNITTGTGNLLILAPIGKDANLGAGQVTISNIVNGNVQAGVGQLTLTPHAKVLGNLTYWSNTSAQINSGAEITGKTTHNIPPEPTKPEKKPLQYPQAFAGIRFIFTIISFLSAVLIGLLLITFLPVHTYQTANLILQKPLQSLGLGFLSMVIAPFIFILLLITVIGIPLDLILLMGFVIFIYIAKIIVGIAIGIKITTLFNKKIALGWTFLLGIFLYYIITIIPVLGFIFWMIAGLMGLGALFLERKYVYTDLRKKHLI